MDYGNQGAVRAGLGGVACVKPWPLRPLRLGVIWVVGRAARDLSRPPGGRKIRGY